MQKASTSASDLTAVRTHVGWAIEVLWLLALFLVPLVFVRPGYMDHSHVIPKVVLYRILVGLAVSLWMLELGLSRSGPRPIHPKLWWSGILAWARRRPARWIVVAASLLLATHLLSTLLSTSVRVSMWGSEPALDGYSAYNAIAHFMLFLVIAIYVFFAI